MRPAPSPLRRARRARPAPTSTLPATTWSSTASTSAGSMLDRLVRSGQPVVLARSGPTIAVARRRAVEVIEAQVVAEDVRDPPLEGVELRERVLADREQEVHAQVGAVDDRGELARRTFPGRARRRGRGSTPRTGRGSRRGRRRARPAIRGALVERPSVVGRLDRASERAGDGPGDRVRSAATGSSRQASNNTTASSGSPRARGCRAPELAGGARRLPGAPSSSRLRSRRRGRVSRDAIRLASIDLALALATEEEERVELLVLERHQPLVRASASRSRSCGARRPRCARAAPRRTRRAACRTRRRRAGATAPARSRRRRPRSSTTDSRRFSRPHTRWRNTRRCQSRQRVAEEEEVAPPEPRDERRRAATRRCPPGRGSRCGRPR